MSTGAAHVEKSYADGCPITERFRLALLADGYSDQTARTYAGQAALFLCWCERKGIAFPLVGEALAHEYLEDGYAALARKSARNRKFALRRFCRWAESEGIRLGDPTAGYRRPILVRERRAPPHPDFQAYFVAQGNSQQTATRYTNSLTQFEAWLSARGAVLQDATVKDVSAFLGAKAQAVGKRALASMLFAVRAYFTYLRVTGQAQIDPTLGLKVKVPPLKAQEPFSEDELARLYAASRTEQERVALLLLLGTGLRASEALSIRCEDINWEQRRLGVLGKGSKYRYLALSQTVVDALAQYTSGRRGDGYVFRSRQEAEAPISYARLKQLVGNVAARAGVTNAHAHRFRTTFAVAFIRAGGDIGALMEALGQSTLAMAIHYARWTQRERALEWQEQVGAQLTDRLDGRSKEGGDHDLWNAEQPARRGQVSAPLGDGAGVPLPLPSDALAG